MVNILYLFVTLPIGGAEEHLLTVLRNIDRSRYNPMVCCIRDKGIIGKEIEDLGIRVVSIERKSKMWDARIVMDIVKIIRKRSIHLLHAHLFHANMYGRIAGLICRIPAIATEHNVYPNYKLKRRAINWLLSKKTAKIIAVSGIVKKYVISRDWVDPAKIEVVYNGIDISRFHSMLTKEEARQKLGVQKYCFLIGTVGRLVDQKGQIYLINALSIMKEIIPEIKLLLVGSGPLEPYLKNEVMVKGLNEYVIFLGDRRDIPDILKAMDIFVLPSLWEGFGIVLLEAMASSLPVVATSVGGVVEIVEDGINGIVVPPRNEAALAQAIVEISKDETKRKFLSERNIKTVEDKFTAFQMVKNIESIYQSILGFD